MTEQEMLYRIAWLEAEVAALLTVCPAKYIPDRREALLPAEKAMSPGERVEYEACSPRVREIFHALSRDAAEYKRLYTNLKLAFEEQLHLSCLRAERLAALTKETT